MFKIINMKNKNEFKDLFFKTYQQAFESIYEKIGFNGWYIENNYFIEKTTERKIK